MLRLGPKLVAMYAAASISVVVGGILAFLLFKAVHPETVAGDTWAGMTALAGSWTGGGANMLAMKEIFQVDATTFGQFAVVDVGVGYVWMAALIFLAGRAGAIDARSGADTRAIDELKDKLAAFKAQHSRVPTLTDLMVIIGIAFGTVGLAHALASPLSTWFGANVGWARTVSLHEPFVWVVLISTFVGLGLSFTRARTLEGAGASNIGTLLLYFLIASIGMQMDIIALFDRPVAVPAGTGLAGDPHPAAVDRRSPAEGAVLLFRHRLAEQHRRSGLGAGGGIGVPSRTRPGGRAAGHARLCDRHGARVCRWG